MVWDRKRKQPIEIQECGGDLKVTTAFYFSFLESILNNSAENFRLKGATLTNSQADVLANMRFSGSNGFS